MRVLLDTCVLLWFLDEPTQIAEPARRTIANARTSVFVSAVSFQEIAIKQSIHRLTVRSPLLPLVAQNRLTPLPITLEHALAMSELPLIHKDPFDRQLVAQCRCEGLTLATRDRRLEHYEIPILAA